jgi:hypothetical protein
MGYNYLCIDILIYVFAYLNTGNILCISKIISKKLAPIILPDLILHWKPITKLNLYIEARTYQHKSIIMGGKKNFSYYSYVDRHHPNIHKLNSNESFYLPFMEKFYDPIEKIRAIKKRINVLEDIYGCNLKNIIMDIKKELCNKIYTFRFEYVVLCAMSLGIKMDENIFKINLNAHNFINNTGEILCDLIYETLKTNVL